MNATSTVSVGFKVIEGTNKKGSPYRGVNVFDTSIGEKDYMGVYIGEKHAKYVLDYMDKLGNAAATVLLGFGEGTRYDESSGVFSYTHFADKKGKRVDLMKVGTIKLGKLGAIKLGMAIRDHGPALKAMLESIAVPPVQPATTPETPVKRGPGRPRKNPVMPPSVSFQGVSTTPLSLPVLYEKIKEAHAALTAHYDPATYDRYLSMCKEYESREV